MSTRYVWDKYDTRQVHKISDRLSYYPYLYTKSSIVTLCNDYEIKGALFYAKGETKTIQEAELAGGGSYSYESTANYRYAIVPSAFFSTNTSEVFQILVERTSAAYYWYIGKTYLSGVLRYVLYQKEQTSSGTISDGANQRFYYYYMMSEPGKGTTIQGQVSNADPNAYPDDGVGTTTASSSNWYVYKGSDNVDPLGVSYNADRPEQNKPIVAIVRPTSATLGGTISYLYQYSINGGATWISAGSATTDTEKEITVPKGAEQFMVRVRAQDDMGFVSNDYVVGLNLKVLSIRMWVGVDGKARLVKKVWVGVDGKAHEVSNGWIGVDGAARRFS